jgi:truncated hemoglobin YjbI
MTRIIVPFGTPLGAGGSNAGGRDIATIDDVGVLVRRFYQSAIPDPVLGPIFDAAGIDWSAHIPRLIDFWAQKLLGIPGYRGNVAGAHRSVFEVGGVVR